MANVFVDTVAWIALVNISDGLHGDALRTMGELRGSAASLVTTECVLLEVANALSAPRLRPRTVAFIDGLRQLDAVHIISASQELLMNGWQLYRQRPDKDWSLTDCISFVVMAQEQITEAFTSDHHFEQAGFVKLLP